jgi:hypothetical protein
VIVDDKCQITLLTTIMRPGRVGDEFDFEAVDDGEVRWEPVSV